jgi:outer membrane protein TolC
MKFRKLITFALVAAIASGMVFPSYAAEEDWEDPHNYDREYLNDTPYTIQYSGIPQIVLSSNLQVENNRLNLQSSSDGDELKEQYEQMERAVEQTSSALSSILNDPSATADLKTVAGGTNTSLSTLLGILEAQTQTGEDDYDLKELQARQTNLQLVKSAQSLFSVYYQLQYNMNQMENTRVTLEDSLKQAQARFNLGLTTSSAVDGAETALTSLDNNMTDLKSQSKSVQYQMNELLGRAYNSQVTFGKMPDPDIDYVNQINLENDKTTAISQNYAIKIYREQRSLIDDSTTEERHARQILNNQMEAQTQSLSASLETQYDTIKKQQAALALDQKSLDSTKQKWDQAKLQYDTGVISRIDLNSAQNAYLKQRTTVKTDQATLFWDIETYRWIVNGLSDS